MKILILADIHANWPALAAVHQAEPDFDECLVLGDLVDFGVDAPEVIAWVRTYATHVIRGNHDHAVAQRIQPHSNSTGLRRLRNETRALHWAQLTQADLDYLAALPVQLTLYRDGLELLLLHATPRDPLNEYLADDPPAWRERLESSTADLVCVGHTHLPFVCDLGRTRVLNPGSVGQPRDGIPTSSYAVLENGKIEHRRVEYPVDQTLERMVRSGLSVEAVQAARQLLSSGIKSESA